MHCCIVLHNLKIKFDFAKSVALKVGWFTFENEDISYSLASMQHYATDACNGVVKA